MHFETVEDTSSRNCYLCMIDTELGKFVKIRYIKAQKIQIYAFYRLPKKCATYD